MNFLRTPGKQLILLILFCSTWSLAHARGGQVPALRKLSLSAFTTNIAPVTTGPHPGQYLLAGGHQFYSLWVRDFAMSAHGAIIAGHDQAVADTLDLIFAYQRADGLLPRQIDNLQPSQRFFSGLSALTDPALQVPPFGPDFDDHSAGDPQQGFATENNVTAIDGNLMVPWIAATYALNHDDVTRSCSWFAKAKLALSYVETNHLWNGVVSYQAQFADWEDSVAREGQVAFSQELYLVALRSMRDWARAKASPCASASDAEQFATSLEAAQKGFASTFWDDKNGKIYNYFFPQKSDPAQLSADANLFAVAEGLLPVAQAKRVMQTMEASALWAHSTVGLPGRVTFPNYPDSMKSPNIKLARITGYHDEMFWPWITALAARAEMTVAHCSEAQRILDGLAQLAVREGAVGEAYAWDAQAKKLLPYQGFFAASERPFTWAAGQILEALAATQCR